MASMLRVALALLAGRAPELARGGNLADMQCGVCVYATYTGDCERFSEPGFDACERFGLAPRARPRHGGDGRAATGMGDHAESEGDSLDEAHRQCAEVCSEGAHADRAARALGGGGQQAFNRTDRRPDTAPPPPSWNLRVTKALGSKGYDKLRVSLISKEARPLQDMGAFDYSGAFEWVWKDHYLHTVVQDAGTPFELDGQRLDLRIPAQGQGTSGVFIADPCFLYASFTTWVDCVYSERFHLATRTPALVNAFVGNDTQVDYWGILGDNFYDRVGNSTDTFFDSLSLETKMKPFATVHGNHDYWVLGTPNVSTTWDQCGNAFSQYYGQDTTSSLRKARNETPYEMSVDPTAGRWLVGCNLPAQSNSFWYNQVGNVGLVGYSSAYSWREQRADFQAACAWAASTPGVDVLFLLGHWNSCSLGCAADDGQPMDVLRVKRRLVEEFPSTCGALAGEDRLKHIMGHTHCNTPYSDKDRGYMVAGWGMHGCGNYGVPVFDTTGGRFRVHYFPISDIAAAPPVDRYDEVMQCLSERRTWRNCLHLAQVWADEALPKRGPDASPAPGVRPPAPEGAAGSELGGLVV